MEIGLAYTGLFLFYTKSVFKTVNGQTSTNRNVDDENVDKSKRWQN